MTHFVAALGTCGTITGAGRFLKSQRPDVKVIGVHPTDGHDIPGVRSRRALALTDFFLPEEYDGILEIGDAEAYALNKRLFLEESLIAGPSSALALAGALKAVPDKPGVVAVVISPTTPSNTYRPTVGTFPSSSGLRSRRETRKPRPWPIARQPIPSAGTCGQPSSLPRLRRTW